jgi:F-type H+-transporting ATPase subunit b
VLTTLAVTANSFVSNAVTAQEIPEEDLNPIALELKELVWGFGAFAVFALVLRYAIWPKLNGSIQGRTERITANHADAAATTASAQGDVADYEAARAAARAEGQAIVDEARAQLEAERTERIAEVNRGIAARRAAAVAEVEAAQEAARAEVEAAVASVTSTVTLLALGREPDPDVLRNVVTSTVNAGAAQ